MTHQSMIDINRPIEPVQAQAPRELMPATTEDHRTSHSILEKSRDRTKGTIGPTLDVLYLLQAKYRLSKPAAKWVLERSPYRPAAAERTFITEIMGVPVYIERFLESEVEAAVLRFEAELRQETALYWSHPAVKGRFTRKPWVDV